MLLLLFAAFRADNFVVGLSYYSPQYIVPVIGYYPECGRYPGAVPPGVAVNLPCDEPLHAANFLIVQLPSTGQISFCEVEICAYGECRTTSV